MPRREDDDRRREEPAQLPTDVDARRIRKTEVENDELRALGDRRAQALRPCRRLADAVGDLPKRVTNGAADLRLVIDDQDAGGLVHVGI